MAWQLVFPESGRRIPLVQGRSVLGSGADADVRIDHPTVSRRHAGLTVSDDAVVVEDLDSSNGTSVGHRPLAGPETVRDHAELEFGLVVAELWPIAEDDTRPAVRIASRAPASGGKRVTPAHAAATLVAESSSRFAIETFPELLSLARLRPDPVTLAARIYAVLRADFGALDFAVEAEGGQALAGSRIDSDGNVDRRAAGRFRILARGPRPERINAAPAMTLCAHLLDLVDSLAHGRLPRAPAPEADARAARPEPVTANRAMREIYDRAERVAPSALSVLIQGETGTGKELLARFVHAASGRAGAFVAVNCAALSRDLLEAELFGIKAGVATGVTAREGRFAQADGGTLLLDEITEMPDDSQAKLLRVLQEREVVAVGARRPRTVDVRVIAATNRSVSARSGETGRLRADLVHRLSGWRVELLPLRKRTEDVPQLAAHFLSRAAERAGRAPAGISRSAMDILCAYDWPGNVRELEQEMHRAALFIDDGELLTREFLSADVTAAGEAAPEALQTASAEAQRRAIEQALAAADGNASAAARSLGISRATFYRRLKKLEIRR
ncbi:MAG: sigma 54-interacting transcriptional regulator [Candidatus Wenzhouxiangella sp. M2_3B_020]